MELLKTILPKNNPRKELNHIYVDNDNMVATDTTIMIIKKNILSIDKPLLIINTHAKDDIKSNDILDNMMINYCDAPNYPDYKRIVPKVENITKLPDKYSFINTLYQITSEHGVMFDYVKNAPLYKKMNKLLGEVEAYQVRDKKSIVVIYSGDYKIIMMPLVVWL